MEKLNFDKIINEREGEASLFEISQKNKEEGKLLSKETTLGIFFNIVGRKMTEAEYLELLDRIHLIKLTEPDRVYNIKDYCKQVKNRNI